MQNTKFHGNQSTGSGEDFRRVFNIYGPGGHLGHVTQMPRTNFHSPYHGGSTQNLALIGQTVLEKKPFENG